MTIADDYRAAAREHGECSKTGDYKTGNKAYARKMKALGKLRKLDDHGEAVLLSLLNDPDEFVRQSAATHLLPLREETAIAALEEMAAAGASSHARFNAKMVL